MQTPLSEQEIDERLATLGGWALEQGELRRSVVCASFPAAIAFVTHIGFLAEAANHHPDIDIRWRTVRLALVTHDAGGITDNDFVLAAAINTLVGSVG